MKILFINLPICNLNGLTVANSPVLGVIYLATILDKAGYQAKVIDAEALGLSWESLSQKVKEENPDIIGITATTLGMPALYKTAEICQEALPDVKIMVGGFGPTLEPEKTLEHCPAIKLVGLNECEDNIIEIVKALAQNCDLSKVRGIVYRKENGGYIRTEPQKLIEDLDTIPLPNYELLEPDFLSYSGVHGGYKDIEFPNAVIMGSRGCPHRCTFCCNAQKRPRFRSAKNIADEIELYKNKYHIKSVQMYDNEFIGMTANENQWVNEVCDEIIKRGLNDLGYIVQGRCNKFIELETLKKMRQAGVRWIWWGVESGSQKILDRIKKDIKVEDVYRAFGLAKQAGIYSLMFLMVGFPDETGEDIKNTAKMIKKIKPEGVRVHITTPLPGSELWQELYEKGQIDEFDYLKYNTRIAVVHHTDTMTREEIKKHYRLLVFRFENGWWYFVKFMAKSLLTVEGWKGLARRLNMVKEYVGDWFKIVSKKNKGAKSNEESHSDN